MELIVAEVVEDVYVPPTNERLASLTSTLEFVTVTLGRTSHEFVGEGWRWILPAPLIGDVIVEPDEFKPGEYSVRILIRVGRCDGDDGNLIPVWAIYGWAIYAPPEIEAGIEWMLPEWMPPLTVNGIIGQPRPAW